MICNRCSINACREKETGGERDKHKPVVKWIGTEREGEMAAGR